MPAQWGVLGCANIARKVCAAIAEGGDEVVAVGSRSKDKAVGWVKENAASATPYGSYDEVLDDPRVQVVYIPLPTAGRHKWVMKAAEKGKHVLCEKPLSSDRQTAEQMVAACAARGVQFMDNSMFVHHGRLAAAEAVLKDTLRFGAVRHVVSCFSIPCALDPAWAANVRMSAQTEPLGCLGDLGWYCVRVSLWAFGYENPEAVRCDLFEQTADGVPITAHAVLRFPGARFATFDCSFKSSLREWVEVGGERLTLTMDDFVVPASEDQAGFVVQEARMGPQDLVFPKEVVQRGEATSVQHVEVTKRMSSLAASGKTDDSWPRMALQTHLIVLRLAESGAAGGQWLPIVA